MRAWRPQATGPGQSGKTVKKNVPPVGSGTPLFLQAGRGLIGRPPLFKAQNSSQSWLAAAAAAGALERPVKAEAILPASARAGEGRGAARAASTGWGAFGAWVGAGMGWLMRGGFSTPPRRKVLIRPFSAVTSLTRRAEAAFDSSTTVSYTHLRAHET